MDVDAGLVSGLIATQFPRWRGYRCTGVRSAGTDHAMYWLGEDLVVRLPRAWLDGRNAVDEPLTERGEVAAVLVASSLRCGASTPPRPTALPRLTAANPGDDRVQAELYGRSRRTRRCGVREAPGDAVVHPVPGSRVERGDVIDQVVRGTGIVHADQQVPTVAAGIWVMALCGLDEAAVVELTAPQPPHGPGSCRGASFGRRPAPTSPQDALLPTRPAPAPVSQRLRRRRDERRVRRRRPRRIRRVLPELPFQLGHLDALSTRNCAITTA